MVSVLGLRRSEVLGLGWEDPDLAEGVLRLQRGLQRVDGGLVVLPTKTRRSTRVVPLPGLVARVLREHREARRAERVPLGPRWPGLGYVLTTRVGTLIDQRNCTRTVHTAVRRAGLPAVRLHDFRDGCVSVLLALGSRPDGDGDHGTRHARNDMNVYAHVSLDDKRSALDQLLDGEEGGEGVTRCCHLCLSPATMIKSS